MNTTLSAHGATERKSASFVRVLPTLVRVLMGLAFVIFGLNGFLNFIPQPSTPLPEGAVAFTGALMKSGYMFPLIAVTQLVAGVLLLTNCFVPLSLALLAPFLVNSVAFHVFLEPTGLIMALIFTLMEVYLAWAYRDAFRPMLRLHTKPA